MKLSKIYSEVCAILEVLGSEYINKIPTKIYQYIVSKKDENEQVEYNISKSIEEQEISKEVLIIISYLNLQYWCSETEKQELLKIYQQNDEKFEQELKEKYDIDKLFENRQSHKETENNQETQLVEYKSKSPIKKLIEKVIEVICFWRK